MEQRLGRWEVRAKLPQVHKDPSRCCEFLMSSLLFILW